MMRHQQLREEIPVIISIYTHQMQLPGTLTNTKTSIVIIGNHTYHRQPHLPEAATVTKDSHSYQRQPQLPELATVTKDSHSYHRQPQLPDTSRVNSNHMRKMH